MQSKSIHFSKFSWAMPQPPQLFLASSATDEKSVAKCDRLTVEGILDHSCVAPLAIQFSLLC